MNEPISLVESKVLSNNKNPYLAYTGHRSNVENVSWANWGYGFKFSAER